jgi:hypothetical protein
MTPTPSRPGDEHATLTPAEWSELVERTAARVVEWSGVLPLVHSFDPAQHAADRERLRAMDERTERIEVLLTGNGHPEHGLVLRVDRLERDRARTVRRGQVWFGAIIGGVVSGTLAALGALWVWATRGGQ